MIDLRQSKASKRGAARVPVIWLVVFLVAALLAFALAWISNDEAAQYAEQARVARAEADTANQRYDEAFREVSTLSERVGFYPADMGNPRTSTEALGTAFEQFRTTFPNMDPSVTTLEEALRRASAAYTSATREVATLKQQLAEANNEVGSKNRQIGELRSEKDNMISDLQRRLQDATAAAEQRQRELEDEVTAVRRSLRDRESELTTTRASLQDQARSFGEREQVAQTRMRELNRKLDVFMREPESADGSILAVSRDLGIAWINRGSCDRMFRGMHFRIRDGAVGRDRIKGMAEVVRVEEDMSEVRLYELADRFDPPVPGDMVFNPLYDPRGGRNAVLVGRFSGTFNEKELRALLAQINVNVQSRVDRSTDFLIVGSEIYEDPATGDSLEDPIAPDELPMYQEAMALGVVAVPVSEVRRYFQRVDV